MVSAPGPVADKREPDPRGASLAAKAREEAREREGEESDDIVEMEPPSAEELDDVRLVHHLH